MLSSSKFFSGSTEKHIGLNGSRTNIFGHHFFMPILTFSRRQASTKVIWEPPLSSLTQTIWLDVYKNSLTSFCVMCYTEWWSPILVKSSGWTSGGPTAQRLIGRVTGLCLVVIFRTVFWERSDRGWQLSSSSSRQLFGQVACLFGDCVASRRVSTVLNYSFISRSLQGV